MGAAVTAPQPEEQAYSLGILERAPLPVDIGQHHQPVGPAGHPGCLPGHDGVGVLAAGGLSGQLRGIEQVPHPAGQGPGGVGAVAQHMGSGHGEDLAAVETAVSVTPPMIDVTGKASASWSGRQ